MKKYFITLIALLLSLVASAAVQIDGLWYNLNSNNNTAEVVASQGTQYSGDISIPTWAYYQNTSYKVTSIGNSVFEGCVDVTSVSIPSSVISIGNGAFWQCSSLKSVYIPDGVKTIGEGAFHNCFNLVSVFIPSSVTSIGSSAFSNCNNLTQVFSLIQNPFSINNNVFTTYSTTTLFTPKGTKSAYQAKSGWKKFSNINDEQKRTINVATAGTLSNFISDCEKYYLEELTLSGELNGTDIFLIRKMAGIYHYTTGRRFDGATYYDTDGILKSLDISNAKIVQGGDAYMATDDRFDFPGVTMSDIDVVHYYTKDDCISALMFYGTRLESIILPNSAISIERAAFRECSYLTSIEIPRNVKNIDISSSWDNPYRISLFCGCTSLSSIEVSEDNNVYDSRNGCNAIIRTKDNTLISGYRNTRIPNSVTSIGNRAFSYCSGLTSLTLPNSVTNIGDYAFSGCSGLTTITSEIQNPFAIDDYVFSNYDTATLIVPAGKKAAYQSTAGWSKFQNIIEVGGTGYEFELDGIRYKIGDNNTVTVCTKEGGYSGDIDIPSQVTFSGKNYNVISIGSAFSGCTALNSISIPYGVTSIGSSAFYGCSGLTSVTIPNSVTYIGYAYVFCGCSSLTSIIIPNSVTKIGEFVFKDCTNLKSVTIGNGVNYIDTGAFTGCNNLTSVYITDLAAWCNIHFEYDGNNYSNPLEIAHHLYLNGTEIKDLTIPSSVKTIAMLSFLGCGGLTSVTIPNSVTSIGAYAFSGCSGLTTITSEIQNPFAIDDYVFSNYATATLVVPDGKKSAYKNTAGWSKFQNIVEVGQGDIIGQEFENNGIRYKIGENNTVSVIQRSQKYSGDVVIPSQVSYNGVNYTVTTIGNMAFGNYCTELTSITIPPTVTCIEEDAFFDYLISLNAVHISDLNAWCSISINGAYSDTCPFNWAKHLFLNGEEIKDLVIPSGVTSINNATFYGCSGLTSITISNSVTSIGSYAFAYCSELTSLTIPNSVTSIGGSAFYGCEDLVRIVSSSKVPPTCESGAFSSKAYCTVWVPMGCREAYLKANEWKDFKEIKEIDGDINLDGKVNKADIDALVTYIMHGTPAIYGTIADLNNDEKVNTADVVMLVNLLNNGGLSTEFQPYFGNDNGNSIVTSITCTLNNDRKEAIQLTKCELYCNNSLVSYKSYSGGSSSTVAAGGSKECSFTGLSMLANSSNFSVVWYYTYNGESYTYRCGLTE